MEDNTVDQNKKVDQPAVDQPVADQPKVDQPVIPAVDQQNAEPKKTEPQNMSIAAMFGVPDFKVTAIQTDVKEVFSANRGNIKATVRDILMIYPDDRKTVSYAMLLLGKLYGMSESQKEIDRNLPQMIDAALTAGAIEGGMMTLKKIHDIEPETVERVANKIRELRNRNNPQNDPDSDGSRELGSF